MAIRRASKSSISTIGAGKRFNLIAGYSPAVDEMDLIERVELTTDQAAVTFSSLGSYQHLQLRGVVRGSSGGLAAAARFNGVSTSSYFGHIFRGNGATASGGNSLSRNNLLLHDDHTNTTYSALFVCDILDYRSTTKIKTIRSIYGYDNNGSGQVGMWTGNNNSTSAITSITLIDAIGGNLKAGSQFSLYGVIG